MDKRTLAIQLGQMSAALSVIERDAQRLAGEARSMRPTRDPSMADKLDEFARRVAELQADARTMFCHRRALAARGIGAEELTQ